MSGMNKRLLNLKEAACYLGKTEKAVYALVMRREIPYRKWSRKLVFDRRDLDRYIDALPGVDLDEALARKHGG